MAWRLLGTYREIPFDGADRGARGESLEIEVGGGERSGFGDGEGWGGGAEFFTRMVRGPIKSILRRCRQDRTLGPVQPTRSVDVKLGTDV